MDRRDRFASAGVFVATFLLRWLTLDFENDYFMHLAWAAEMLRGALPVRDFVEPGFILQTFVSYVAFRAGGYQLLWEGLIASALIAASTALIYSICRRLGIPRGFALVVVLIAAATYPRLYAYPKAFVYAAALWSMVNYQTDPRRRSLYLMSAVTAVAFLFRHDHGVWIAVAVTLSLLLFHMLLERSGAIRTTRTILEYGALSVLLVAPWLGWVALSGHADQYFGFLAGQSGGLITNRRLPDVRFGIDRSAPLFTLAAIDYPKVGIRWAPHASDDDRRERETRYRLEPLPGETNRYRLTNLDSANVRALVLDAAVEDTNGIDRGAFRAPAGLFAWTHVQLQRYVPTIRLRALPGIMTERNALTWLTWVTFIVPWVALAVATRPALIVPAAVLSIITYQTLVRRSPDSRLGDIAAVTALLCAWAAWRAWNVRGWPRLMLKPIVVIVLALTFGSAVSSGNLMDRLATAGVDGPTNLARRARAVAARYAMTPLEVFAPPGTPGLAGLSRWLNACTRPADRVAVMGFEPQVFVIAARGFAGGNMFYELAWNSSEADQRLTIDRWSRQAVPVVLAMDYEWNRVARDYPLVRRWIDERYEAVRRSTFGGSNAKELTVLVDRSRQPFTQHAATGLPCFL